MDLSELKGMVEKLIGSIVFFKSDLSEPPSLYEVSPYNGSVNITLKPVNPNDYQREFRTTLLEFSSLYLLTPLFIQRGDKIKSGNVEGVVTVIKYIPSYRSYYVTIDRGYSYPISLPLTSLIGFASIGTAEDNTSFI
tara:strand:- start:13 stop:423 length:411 start_codon:yes stop_codon:yes gene_type:complete